MAGFEVLITVDMSIPDQQSFAGWKISLVILIAATNRLRDLLPLIPATLRVLDAIPPGRIEIVSRGSPTGNA